MKIRDYLVTYSTGFKDVTRGVAATSPKQARAKLAAMPDLLNIHIEIKSVKAVPGTARELDGGADDGHGQAPEHVTDKPGGDPAAGDGEPDSIKRQIAKAEIITDEPPPDQAGDYALDENPAPQNDMPDSGTCPVKTPKKLTPEQCDILRECAQLDENDADNGRRLLKWFGDRVLHVAETGWFVWTGTHWEGSTGNFGVEKYAQSLVPLIKREAGLIEMTAGEVELLEEADKLRAKYPTVRGRPEHVKASILLANNIKKAFAGKRSSRYKFAIKTGDRSRTMALINQAVSRRTVMPRELDSSDRVLNCLNGTVHFKTIEDMESDQDDPRMIGKAELKPHNPGDLLTKVTACEYDEGATAPEFMKDLEHFMPDAATREFLKVFMGYVMLGSAGEQVYAFFYGDGANWKSAFLQAIARTVGGYYKPMSYTSVSGNNMPTGDKPSPDWARLPGVRFLTIEEIPRKEPIKEELIKMVTSGAAMPVRHLNKGLFDMIPKFTCIMTSNAEPNIHGHDKGIWRRTMIVHWSVSIDEDKRLPFDTVMAKYDKERPGILNWLIEGACQYLGAGLWPYVTPGMKEFTASVRADRDAVGSFLHDCVIERPDHYITAKALYDAFVQYCNANGIEPVLNSTAFGRQVKPREVGGKLMMDRKHKVQGVRRFRNIDLHDLPPAPGGDGDAFP
jgi:putative DNA primase/helicase